MAVPNNTVQVDGVGTVVADDYNTYLQGSAGLNGLSNFGTGGLQNFIGNAGMIAYVPGLTSIADGNQGFFYWNATGVANDGVNNIQPDGVSLGCWTRVPASGGLSSIPSNTLLANITVSAAIPTATTLTALIDSAIGGTQGGILYRNATVWALLPPGTVGQVLTTEGGAANPQWGNTAGTGTVTSIATGAGLTGGTITSAGTVSLAAINSGDLLANATGGSAAPADTTLTALLDTALGATQGSIIYRGASTWTLLGPGSSGQVLQTNGASANPSWVNNSNTLPAALGIGSYIIASSGFTQTAGDTVSAATLGHPEFYNSALSTNAWQSSGDTIAGTWRCMQSIGTGSGSGLWLRIS